MTINEPSEKFVLFAKECEEESPLYARLSRGIAKDEELLDIAAEAASIPVTNLLFGAVHAILLGGAEHELKDFYPNLTDEVREGDPLPAFRDFCLMHRGEIAHTLKTRRVQTNEVRRSALLFPALSEIGSRVGEPLALIEVGASAGLNLAFDRYSYDYGPYGRIAGESSRPTLRCEVRKGSQTLPDTMPRVASRVGLDLSPLDVLDGDDVRWLEALIWPEDFHERSNLLREAVEVCRESPPELVAGDALETLPVALESVPDGAHPVVLHTFTINQFPEEMRERFARILTEHGPLHELSIGWRPGEPFARIEVTRRPGSESELLAECDAHGRWISWSHPSA